MTKARSASTAAGLIWGPGDLEPALGWPEGHKGSSVGGTDDAELEDAEAELSLGWGNTHRQIGLRASPGDREDECDDEGDTHSDGGGEDVSDAEPSLGWANEGSQADLHASANDAEGPDIETPLGYKATRDRAAAHDFADPRVERAARKRRATPRVRRSDFAIGRGGRPWA